MGILPYDLRGQFHKSFNVGIFCCCKNVENYILAFKTTVFLATNIEQQVAYLCVFVALFGILVAHFGVSKPNSYCEIKPFFGVVL